MPVGEFRLLALTGVEGKLFAPIAISTIVSMAASFVVSVTVIPVLASFLLNPKAGKQPALAAADSADASARVVAPGQKLRARRRADVANVKVLQRRAISSQRINVWSREIRIAVDTQITPSLIVCQNNDDIRRPSWQRPTMDSDMEQENEWNDTHVA